MGALTLLGRIVRAVVRFVEEGILALLRTTRWLLNRIHV